jgi:phosphoribosylglycinamide formyltransferase 1
MSRRRIAILISGRGSNMVSLLEAACAPDFPAEIALVLSNRPDAEGLDRARQAGIEALAIDHKAYSTRESFEQALDEALRARDIELICLAGFMRVLTNWFVERWTGRMINIHPSLLPLFRGIHTHRRALEEGVLVHGCTVHFVVPELDAGPIVAQAVVPVVPGDTETSLAARVLEQEHKLYPQALRMICSGLARLDNGRVVFGKGWSAAALLSPADLAPAELDGITTNRRPSKKGAAPGS